MMPPEGAIFEYVRWASTQGFIPPQLHLGAILPIAAYEATRGSWVEGQPWRLPWRGTQGAIQSFLVADPSVGKSSAMRLAKGFHEALIGLTRAEDPINRPATWLQAEGTVQGLLEAVHDAYDEDRDVSAAIFYHEEVSSLFSQGGVVIDTLMQLFDATPAVERHLREYRKMRKAGQAPPSKVVKPAVGGVFCATPSSLERSLVGAHFEGGLISRTLFFTGRPPTFEEMSEAEREEFLLGPPAPLARERQDGRRRALDHWTHLGRRLAGLRVRGAASLADFDSECRSILKPELKKLSDAASAGDVTTAAGLKRGINQAQLIASLYALSRGSLKVRPEDLRAALKLLEASHAIVEGLVQSTALDPIYRLTQKALGKIRDAGPKGIGRSALNRQHLRSSAGVVDQVVELLKESGDVLVSHSPSRRGRPGMRFVHRAWLDSPNDNLIQFPGSGSDENTESE